MNINNENTKIYTEQTGDWHEYNSKSEDEIVKALHFKESGAIAWVVHRIEDGSIATTVHRTNRRDEDPDRPLEGDLAPA